MELRGRKSPRRLHVVAVNTVGAGESNAGELPLGTMIRRYRQAAGLTQEALAERAGISPRGLRETERDGGRFPRHDTLRRIVTALDLAPAEAEGIFRRARTARLTDAPHGPRPTPLLAPLASPPPGARIPVSGSALVGRDADVAAVGALIDAPDARVVTLVGPPGVGKTRLACALAELRKREGAARVAYVSLAQLSETHAVLPACARALGAYDSAAEDMVAAIAGALGAPPAPTLLVLDNLEHLLPAALDLADLLAACPSLRILATSRVALRLSGEVTYQVAPLPTARLDRLPPIEELALVPAIDLFVRRARRGAPAFALTGANAGTVAAVCERLDGLPLAIELAAGWLRLLPLTTLLARLNYDIDLLCDGPRDLAPRQRALADAVGWSYDLLDPPARRLFRWLAAFSGDTALDEVERLYAAMVPATAITQPRHPIPDDAAVGPSHHEGSGPDGVIQDLATLTDASLIQPHTGASGVPRFRMLQTLRAHAGHLLAQDPDESDRVEAAHATAYLALAETAAAGLKAGAFDRWMSRLEEDEPNLQIACAWALRQRPDVGIRLGAALARYWYQRGAGAEQRGWYRRLFALDADLLAAQHTAINVADAASAGSEVRALVTSERAELDKGGGEGAADETFATRYATLILDARHLARTSGAATRTKSTPAMGQPAERGDDMTTARSRALSGLANLYYLHGDLEAAGVWYTATLTVRRALGDLHNVAATLNNLGEMKRLGGDYAAAVAFYAESITIRRQLGDANNLVLALVNHAAALRSLGAHEQAHASILEAAALAREAGNGRWLPAALEGLGALALDGGNPAEAESHLEAALTLLRAAHDEPGSLGVLLNLVSARVRGPAPAHAWNTCEEAFTLARRLRHEVGLIEAVERVAYLLAARAGAQCDAVYLLAATEAQRIRLRAAPTPREVAGHTQILDRLRAAINDDETFAATWAKGTLDPWQHTLDATAHFLDVFAPPPNERAPTAREE